MDELTQAFGGFNATVFLWIAGAVAAVFVIIVLFDAIKQRRKNARMMNKRRARAADKNKSDAP